MSVAAATQAHPTPGKRVRACAWCGNALDGAVQALRGRVRCPNCGVATTDPWPSDHELATAYGGWYRPASGRFAGPGDRLLHLARGALARRIDSLAPPGPVLDVGAGDGALLDALSRVGRRASGLERTATRPDLSDRDLLQIDGEWAAIVFWHSLEHLRAPGLAIDHAVDLLAPGGLLIVAIPDASSLQARVFGDRWFALDLPRHLVHVPGSAVRARIRAAGLRVGRVSGIRGGQVVFAWLHGLVGSLPGQPDLYDAIRRPEARRLPLSRSRRAAILAAGGLLLPVASLCSAAEITLRRSGTLYLEARKATG